MANYYVAVGEEKGGGFDEGFGQLRGFAGAILNGLPAIDDSRVPFGSICKIIFDHLRPKAGHDENIANPSPNKPTQDMLENWLSVHCKHGLGELMGQFFHPCSLTCCQNNGFHYLVLIVILTVILIEMRLPIKITIKITIKKKK